MSDEDVSRTAAAAAALARAVRERRGRLGLTLDALSRRTGLSKGFLSQMEAGEANPTLNTLVRLAEALRTSPAGLLAGAGAPSGAHSERPGTSVADDGVSGGVRSGAPGPGLGDDRDGGAATHRLDERLDERLGGDGGDGGDQYGDDPAAFAVGARAVRTTRRPARPLVAWPEGAGRTYVLTAPGAGGFQVLLVDGVPEHHAVEVGHEGEEFCVVLAGAVDAEVDGVGYRLAEGDALHYDSGLPHRLTPTTPRSRLLLVL